MKKQVWIWAVLLSLLLSAFSFSVSATVPPYPEKVVFDYAELLSKSEITAITETLWEKWEAADCCFYLVTYPNATVREAGGREHTGNYFLRTIALSQNKNAVILVIHKNGGSYFYDMFYYGDAPRRIPEKEVNYILDHPNVYDSLKSGELERGSVAFFDLAEQAYSGRVGTSYAVIGAVSFLIALVIGVVACVSVKTAYSMKQKSVDYPLNRFAKLDLKAQNDVFTGAFVTQRIIESSSGGKGGRGGGGGGGHAGGR